MSFKSNLEKQFKNETLIDFTYITNYVLESTILKHFQKKIKYKQKQAQNNYSHE